MTVVDTSAAMAVLIGERTAPAIRAHLDTTARCYISAGTLQELGIVLESRIGAVAPAKIERFLRDSGTEVVPVDQTLVDRAVAGWRQFGKGRHPAALNYGDCFAYALASTRNLPVLCTGDDFAHTDITVVPLSD
ncbi:type II toxin-antitoxin system VapC family toxin [Sporichthya sp.]|uniref:type II toxin-antitoxin system VapC family toxin n=1 Tax=Sporichthya sp. TaxID=65475 RepID=UPI0018142F76|nr:type II toxin-antitoxin system VapC family toxin [Sporichthya sp.]MBA3742315.1 type II toxin-antitoxin system VapC family toxin [Sporichthya sp.]